MSILPETTSGPASDAGASHPAPTAGVGRPKIWRRVFHATSGCMQVAVIRLFDLEPPLLFWLMAGACAWLLAVDLVRLRVARANQLFFRSFSAVTSSRELRHLASSTWYQLGVFLTVLLFPLEIALPAMLCLALGDPAAALARDRGDGRPLLGHRGAGSILFFVVCVAVIAPLAGVRAALAGALAGTLVERIPWGLVDDNLTIPVAVAAGIRLAGLA